MSIHPSPLSDEKMAAIRGMIRRAASEEAEYPRRAVLPLIPKLARMNSEWVRLVVAILAALAVGHFVR